VASIVGLGKACEIAGRKLEVDGKQVSALRDTFERLLMASVGGIEFNGDLQNRLGNTSNVSFENVDGEALLMVLDKSGLCCSAGSACTSGAISGSQVMKAMGFSEERSRRSLRFSFSRMNTEVEIAEGVRIVASAVEKIRSAGRMQ
jgi:cysteine desulfurase